MVWLIILGVGLYKGMSELTLDPSGEQGGGGGAAS